MPAQYPTNLPELFSNNNPFLAQMGTQQWNQAQEQNNQDLAAQRQTMAQDAEMQPVKIRQGNALADQYSGQARASNATAATSEDSLKILQSVPQDKRVATAVAQQHALLSKAQQEALAGDMSHLQVYAAQGIANGGKLPLAVLQKAAADHPDLMPYLTSPQGLAKAAQVVNAHNALDSQRQANESVAKIHAAATTGAASIAANASTSNNQANIDAGKFKNHTSSFLLMKALSGGNFEQASVAAMQMARELQAGGDTAGAQQYAAQAEEFYNKWKSGKEAAGVEANKAKPDLNPLGIPTVTPPGGKPSAAPQKPSKQAWMAAARAAPQNKGISDAELESHYTQNYGK